MPGDADRVKERLDIVELIGEYLQLQRAGSANFKARCPFHGEKTPSFYVSRERQMWHCFGCGEGGDHFTFVQKMEGTDFSEALKLLADRAGVKLERYDAAKESERTRLVGLLELAAKFFEKVLWEHPGAEAARQYVASRDLPEAAARAFRIGYAPDSWDSLALFLAGRDYREDEIVKAGLGARREQAAGIYDRFRGRLMFPIANPHGHIVGFTGRILDPNAKEAKYVNTPETALYKKGSVLYALDRAKQAIKKVGYALVVEGNMDAVACHKIGMEQTVASSGTALTRDQLALLGRFTNTIFIAFDADAAGESAARRGIDLAIADGFSVKIVRIPEGCGKDPDDCIRKNPDEFREAVARAVPYMEYLFSAISGVKDLASAEGKKEVGNALLQEIAKLPDPIEQTHWLQRLSSLIHVSESVLRERLPHGSQKPSSHAPAPTAPAIPATDRSRRLSEEFLELILTHPEHAGIAVNAVRPEMLTGGDIQALYTDLVLRYTGASSPHRAGDFELREELSPLERRLLFEGERDFGALGAQAEEEIRRYSNLVRSDHLTREKMSVQSAMLTAEQTGDLRAADDLARRFNELIQMQ